eukprot:CAMPEP_0182527466 /NCGR_PEP_ID=MMETSP1323-20130603/3864_1 /TAXON_ID=236787 /ORGANISM="Florenciella parvula, Strain RCC1693" /LENGTH=96 /DNA_ID=CAMNT_0024736455 /DNA_START=729 /DNA_END=1016 /DNA_ORIENTATION=-
MGVSGASSMSILRYTNLCGWKFGSWLVPLSTWVTPSSCSPVASRALSLFPTKICLVMWLQFVKSPPIIEVFMFDMPFFQSLLGFFKILAFFMTSVS